MIGYIKGEVAGIYEDSLILDVGGIGYNVNMPIPISEDVLLLCGDVDGDSEVSVIDATFIQRYDAMIKTPYPIGEPIS